MSHTDPSFSALFHYPPAVTAAAPGRVNLIGEHTDYNGGFVLPTAIPRHTRIALAPRPDTAVRVASAEVDAGAVQRYRLGEEARGRGWLDYIQGVTVTLRTDGHDLRGFDAWIESDVPLGSGLSSSASLTVSLLRALREVYSLALTDVQIAVVAQRAENEFVGALVGVMDPMAVSLADEHAALFLDTRDLTYERVAIPASMEVVVLSSGVSHRNVGGGYNQRRAECERAAALLGVAQLRDLTPADLPRLAALPEPLGRRARHVVTEDERVLDAVAALRADDPVRLGMLFAGSHASMRDDYEVSIAEIDLIVRLAAGEPGIYGARLTGGGFGGSVVMLARPDAGRTAARRIAAEYGRLTGHVALVV